MRVAHAVDLALAGVLVREMIDLAVAGQVLEGIDERRLPRAVRAEAGEALRLGVEQTGGAGTAEPGEAEGFNPHGPQQPRLRCPLRGRVCRRRKRVEELCGKLANGLRGHGRGERTVVEDPHQNIGSSPVARPQIAEHRLGGSFDDDASYFTRSERTLEGIRNRSMARSSNRKLECNLPSVRAGRSRCELVETRCASRSPMAATQETTTLPRRQQRNRPSNEPSRRTRRSTLTVIPPGCSI